MDGEDALIRARRRYSQLNLAHSCLGMFCAKRIMSTSGQAPSRELDSDSQTSQQEMLADTLDTPDTRRLPKGARQRTDANYATQMPARRPTMSDHEREGVKVSDNRRICISRVDLMAALEQNKLRHILCAPFRFRPRIGWNQVRKWKREIICA